MVYTCNRGEGFVYCDKFEVHTLMTFNQVKTEDGFETTFRVDSRCDVLDNSFLFAVIGNQIKSQVGEKSLSSIKKMSEALQDMFINSMA